MAAVAALSAGCDTQLARTTSGQSTMEENTTTRSLTKTCCASVGPLGTSELPHDNNVRDCIKHTRKQKLRAGKEPQPTNQQKFSSECEGNTVGPGGLEALFTHCMDDLGDDSGGSASDTEVVVMVDGTDDDATTTYTKTKRIPAQPAARSFSGSPSSGLSRSSSPTTGMALSRSTSSLQAIDCTQSNVHMGKSSAIGFFPGVVRASRWQTRSEGTESVSSGTEATRLRPNEPTQNSDGGAATALRSTSEDDNGNGVVVSTRHTPRSWGRGGRGHRRIRSDVGPMIPSIGMPMKIGKNRHGGEDTAPTCGGVCSGGVCSGGVVRRGAWSSETCTGERRMSSDRGWKARSTGGLVIPTTHEGDSEAEASGATEESMLPPMNKPLRNRHAGHRRHRSYGSLEEISIDVSELSTATTPSVMTFREHPNASCSTAGGVDKTVTMGDTT